MFADSLCFIACAIAVASLVAAITPTPRDDKFIGKIYKIFVDGVALNIGRAKDIASKIKKRIT
jgi:hypothetical protein